MQKGNFTMKDLTKEERKWCVYVHINKVNGKMYVGITSKKPTNRWSNGKGYKNNSYFTNSIQKYGWDNFEHIVVCQSKNKQEAENIEKYLIKVWNTKIPNGYNLTVGGGTINIPQIKERKAILQFDLDGKLIAEYDYVNSIEKNASTISSCCRGHSLSAYNNIWLYKSDYIKNPQILKDRISGIKNYNHRRKAVLQFNLSGTLINEYDSITNACLALNKTISDITLCCQGKYNRSGEYIWLYKKDYDNNPELLMYRIKKIKLKSNKHIERRN
jgi:group I intron endonuclease